MALPSFSLQIYLGALRSSLGYSNLALFLCVLGGFGVLCLGGEAWERSGLKRTRLEVSHV